MGKLGFNLVGQKDLEKAPESEITEAAEKTPVETVVVVDKLQNKKNENSEESRLREIIKTKNLTIAKLRSLVICLALATFLVIGFVLFFSIPEQCLRPEDNEAVLQIVREKFNLDEKEAYFLTELLSHRVSSPEVARFEIQADAMTVDNNCTATRIELEQVQAEKERLETKLNDEKELFEDREDDSKTRYRLLQDSFVALQKQQELLAAEFATKEEKMHGEIEKLTEERADLEKKIEAGNKKLQQLQQRNSRQQQAATKTTTEQPQRGLFDNNQLKKFNDLVKDIETVGRIFTNAFMDAL